MAKIEVRRGNDPVDEALEKAKRDGMDMYGKAMKHNGRYLLPRRFRKGDPEKDALYNVWLIGPPISRVGLR